MLPRASGNREPCVQVPALPSFGFTAPPEFSTAGALCMASNRDASDSRAWPAPKHYGCESEKLDPQGVTKWQWRLDQLERCKAASNRIRRLELVVRMTVWRPIDPRIEPLVACWAVTPLVIRLYLLYHWRGGCSSISAPIARPYRYSYCQRGPRKVSRHQNYPVID